MTIVTVNGHQVETGCWVEGHWGQYGPDHLADQASSLGWEPTTCLDDPREIRRIIDQIETWGYPRDFSDMSSEGVGIIGSLWEAHTESVDDIERWLNNRTGRHHVGMKLREPGPGLDPIEQNYIWHWHDGEFFLSPICDDPDDCTDETCAHWD